MVAQELGNVSKEGCSQLYLSSYSAGTVVRAVQVSTAFVEVCCVEIFKIINSLIFDGQFLHES